MSTSCKIGIAKETDHRGMPRNIKCIICWRDGHPNTAGATLTNHYDTYEKAAALIAGGQLYDLGENIEKCRYQSSDPKIPAEKCRPLTYRSLPSFIQDDQDTQFAYIFTAGKWHVYEY